MIREKNKNIILFDGYCNLCSGSVQFIIRNDPKEIYRFESLQSDVVSENWPEIANSSHFGTVVLIENGKKYYRSGAALRIARKLRFPVNLFSVFFIIPAFIRDPVYNWIARNRFKWFGRRDSCFAAGKERMLGSQDSKK